MRSQLKLAVGVLLAAFLVVTAIQCQDAWEWATSPWLGVTLRGHGRLNYRQLAEVPPDLQPLLKTGDWYAVAARREGAEWVGLQPVGAGPRAAYDRLHVVLDGAPEGTPVDLRLVSGTGNEASVRLRTGQVPAAFVLERFGLFMGMAFLIALFGAGVFRARPDSPPAMAFVLFSLAIGFDWATNQVRGSFPTRFDALAAAASFAVAAAALTLALVLEPRPWLAARPWVHGLPWTLAAAGLLVQSHLPATPAGNWSLAACRLLAWLGFLGYVVWLRATTASRQRARQLEFYLVGMAVAFAPVLFAYARPRSSDVNPSPYVMLTVLAFPAVIGYGILRHRLFDIDIVLRRSVAYLGLTAVSVAIYLGLALAAGGLLGAQAATVSPVQTALLVTMAAVAGGSLRLRMQRLVDRRLNPGRFRYLEALREASADVAALRSEEAVARSLARVATEVARLRGASIYLRRKGRFLLAARSGDTGEQSEERSFDSEDPLVQLTRLVSSHLHRDDFEHNPKLAPLRASCLSRLEEVRAHLLVALQTPSSGLLGLLTLGPRLDGEPFNSEDLDLLRTLCNQAALAVERAREAAGDEETGARPSASIVPLAPGARLGRYRVERPLGRGGMGTVFLALDERLGRRVALKLLREEQRDDPTLERLRREARLLAALDHPNILRIHALEREAGHDFLVIEYLESRTLQEELAERGRLPEKEAVEIAIAVSEALGCAHAQGIIHRDVKPGNIMRARGGTVRLTDFGLAKPEGDEPSITATGHIVGTLGYLAPEVLLGAPSDHRSDMYSLGVTLHRLLTGKSPWATQTTRGADLLSREVTAAGLAGQRIPQPVVPVLLRLLDLVPERRYRDYVALVAALTRARDQL